MLLAHPSTGTKALWMGEIKEEEVMRAVSTPKNARDNPEETVMGWNLEGPEG